MKASYTLKFIRKLASTVDYASLSALSTQITLRLQENP